MARLSTAAGIFQGQQMILQGQPTHPCPGSGTPRRGQPALPSQVEETFSPRQANVFHQGVFKTSSSLLAASAKGWDRLQHANRTSGAQTGPFTTCKKTIKKTRPRAPLPLLYPHFNPQHTLPSALPSPASTAASLPNSFRGTAKDLSHLWPPAELGCAKEDMLVPSCPSGMLSPPEKRQSCPHAAGTGSKGCRMSQALELLLPVTRCKTHLSF